MEESEIEGETKTNKLLVDLNFEKELEIYKIMEIEIKLEKLKITETIINRIKKLVIAEKYLYHIS